MLTFLCPCYVDHSILVTSLNHIDNISSTSWLTLDYLCFDFRLLLKFAPLSRSTSRDVTRLRIMIIKYWLDTWHDISCSYVILCLLVCYSLFGMILRSLSALIGHLIGRRLSTTTRRYISVTDVFFRILTFLNTAMTSTSAHTSTEAPSARGSHRCKDILLNT